MKWKPLLPYALAGLVFALPAFAQSSNPWAVPKAPVLVPGQLFASTSGTIGQSLFSAPDTGLIPRQTGSFSSSGSGPSGGSISFGDYPPLDGLPGPAPAIPYGVAPRMAPGQPPVPLQQAQPYYAPQAYAGSAYAYAPYGAPYGGPAYGAPYGGPAYGAPYGGPAYGAPFGGMAYGAPYGGLPGYGLRGVLPGGVFPGSTGMFGGMFGGPYGGANLTPWGMGSPWMW